MTLSVFSKAVMYVSEGVCPLCQRALVRPGEQMELDPRNPLGSLLTALQPMMMALGLSPCSTCTVSWRLDFIAGRPVLQALPVLSEMQLQRLNDLQED